MVPLYSPMEATSSMLLGQDVCREQIRCKDYKYAMGVIIAAVTACAELHTNTR